MSRNLIERPLSALVEVLQADDEEVVITKNGKVVAVLVSPDEYGSWRETQHVLSYAELMSEIKRGLEELREKQVPLYTLEELFDEEPRGGQ